MLTPHDVASGDWSKLIAAVPIPKSHEFPRRENGSASTPDVKYERLQARRQKETYLITSPDSVSILSTQEEVLRAHRVEVESRAPMSMLGKLY